LPDQFQFLGLGVTDWLAILTLGVLVFQSVLLLYQTRIVKAQTKIQQDQTDIQKTQLELSEKVKLSAQPYFDAKANRLKVNFKDEGKGSADATNVQYILKEKASSTLLLGVAKLQALASGSTAEIDVTSHDIQTLLGKYETLLLSWQGTRADGKPFDGSLPEVQLSQLATISRI